MTDALTIKAALAQNRAIYNAVAEVLENDDFMAGVFESLEAERAGAKGKTIEEIRREHGLMD